jgi:hypothetical protein
MEHCDEERRDVRRSCFRSPADPITLTTMQESIVVSALFIYPVKSLRGVAVDSASIKEGRFCGDREYLVMDGEGHFMDQRHYPQMARVEATLTTGGLRLRSAGFPDLDVRSCETSAAARSVTHVPLFRRSAPLRPTTAEADQWLSDVLGVPCRLMAFVLDAPALNVPSYEVHSSLHDATPFHLTSEESLADLNARARTTLPMNRFRPNLVVRGASAYAEDSWKTVAVGDTILRWIKACTRCVTTTTDQTTGERRNREPLLTLSRYRRESSAVVFGHYLMAERCGPDMRVGDAVRIVE